MLRVDVGEIPALNLLFICFNCVESARAKNIIKKLTKSFRRPLGIVYKVCLVQLNAFMYSASCSLFS